MDDKFANLSNGAKYPEKTTNQPNKFYYISTCLVHKFQYTFFNNCFHKNS